MALFARKRLVIFSGGTAVNPLSLALSLLTPLVTYILPVTDDGGSSAEILRVLSGPAIGDIRSRCVRLVKHRTSDTEGFAAVALLQHRLPARDRDAAFVEWMQILQGQHELICAIQPHKAQIIRTFLVHFHTAILTASPETLATPFDFRNGSIGMRLFLASLEASIFLFNRVIGIPSDSLVLPIIEASNTLSIGVQLQDGTHIIGQSAISHPVNVLMGAHVVEKAAPMDDLPSPVERVYYLNEYRQEFVPSTNSRVLQSLSEPCEAIIYGMGSLYTSIIPTLVLPGIGENIAQATSVKLLLLNTTEDRETKGMSAVDFVRAITAALNRYGELNNTSYLTHIVYGNESQVRVDIDALKQLGLTCVQAPCEETNNFYDSNTLAQVIFEMSLM